MDARLTRWYDTAAIWKRFPVVETGDARLEQYEVTREVATWEWEKEFRKNGRDSAWIGMMDPGVYVRLLTGKGTLGSRYNETLEMSNTRMEFLTNLPLLDHAKGRVLIAGLGLGLIVHELLLKKDVENITVVEKNQDVIDLVSPTFDYNKGENLNIFHGDAYTFHKDFNERVFDTIYFDIWPDMKYPTEERRRLYRSYKRTLDEKGVMWAWGAPIPKAWRTKRP